MRYPWLRFVTGYYLVALVVACFLQISAQDATAVLETSSEVVVLEEGSDAAVDICETDEMTFEPGLEFSEVVLYTRVVSELVKTFYIA